MKKSLIILAMLAACGAASAQEATANSQAGSASQAGASSGSQAEVTINNTSPETQTLNYNQTVTGTTRAEQILSGGYTNTENNNVHYSGTQTLKNVPAIAMSGPASGPCTGFSGGVGLAGPGWGVGVNGSSVMVDCRVRENVRVTGMAMQSVDGGAYPQEKGELMVMFMDSVRGLAAINAKIVAEELGKDKK